LRIIYYKMVDKEQILSEFINGDIDNFYMHMYSPLLAYAVRILGNNYSFLAEDCVQDAIASGYEKRSTFEFSWKLKSFLFTCVHNNCIDLLRKTKRQENFVSQQNEVEEEISAGMIEQETIDMMRQAINELPEKYRQIFELYYEKGLKMKEVADLLDVTFETLKKRKSKMFSLLRERFKDNQPILELLFILAMC
jgi:RNA polymerase sigma factor (sigma-70 family)